MTTGRFDTASDVLFKLVLTAMVFAAGALLLRDAMALTAHVPRDPNEGWNAYLAHAAMTGAPLYPQGLMINNYPPLSFYVVGALGAFTGDFILAGRLLSLIAFLAAAGSMVMILRTWGAGVLAALFGSLFFALGLLAASDYVAMNDPQLLGHALQLAALYLLLQAPRKILLAAGLMAAGLFVKHNLLALPLAASFWLAWQDRRAALRFAIAGAALCIAGFVMTRVLLNVNLLTVLASPRLWQMRNFTAGAEDFSRWAGAALLITAAMAWHRRNNPSAQFVALYAGVALVLGGLFAFGDGVDANIFFDAAIALGFGAGLALQHIPKAWVGPLALCAAAPLALYMAQNSGDANFAFSEAFAREAPPDIAFLRSHPGPAICEDLSLCYWAGKDAPVDVFNLSEAMATGKRGDADLAGLLQAQHFGSIAVSSLTDFAPGPHLKNVLLARYRIDHEDDNGVFLEPR